MSELIHDAVILGYNVDFETQHLQLKVETVSGEKAVVDFTDFLAHYFNHVMPGSVIFDISESAIEYFLEDHEEEFMQFKNYYWPVSFKNINELITYMKREEYHCYIIFSSVGLNGFIFAKHLSIKEV